MTCPEVRGQGVEAGDNMLRALVAASSPMHRAGLCGLLAHLGVEVAATACSVKEAVLCVQDVPFDLLVLEARLLHDARADSLEALRTATTRALLVVLSLYGEPALLADALRLESSCFLYSKIDESSVRLAIEGAKRGLVMTERPAFLALRRRISLPARGANLTAREWQVLNLLAQGLTTRRMAEQLGISVHTVYSHISRTMGKLHLSDRLQAIVWARNHGLGSVDGDGQVVRKMSV